MNRHKAKDPKPADRDSEHGTVAPLVADEEAQEIAAPAGGDCLVVFCCSHEYKSKQYAVGDSLNVSPMVRDKLRHFGLIY